MRKFKRFLKVYSLLVVGVLVFAESLVLVPAFFQAQAYDPENLTIEISGENIDAPSMHEYPFSNTNIGAIPYNRIRITVNYCNNDPDPATNARIDALIPRDVYQGGNHYFNAQLDAIGSPPNTTLKYYDDMYTEITPNPNSYHVDDNVAVLSWEFNVPIAPGTCDSYTYNLVSYHTVEEGVDVTVQGQTAITCAETGYVWNYSNIITIRLLTTPLFNIMYGEDNFYKGSFTSNLDPDSNWVDPLDNVQDDQTVYHRIYLHNYTYETEARGIRVTIVIPQSPEYATSWTLPAEVTADNADSISDTLQVNLAAGEEESHMNFVEGSLVLYGDPQWPSGPSYNNTPIPHCSTNGGAVPCYTFNEGTGVLEFTLPNQIGCSPYVMNAIFATIFAQQPPPPPPPQERGFVVRKEVVGPTSYQPDQDVTFQVTIENTGDVRIDTMLFIDQYNPSYLEFRDISGRRGGGSNISLRDVIEPQNPNGAFRIDNLATYLGGLSPGEQYVLTILFRTKSVIGSSVTTCNIAIADDGINQRQSEVCITINPVYVPPTDR